MNNDSELAPYVAQFVPIKLDTSTKDWQKWERAHQSEGNGIPVVYIVRADGETMYAKSGGLKTPALAELLGQCLDNSGRVFSDRDISKMLKVDEEVTELRKKGEIAKAIDKLSRLKKLGVGSVSYAKPAIALSQHVSEISEKGKKELDTILKNLTDAEGDEKQVAVLNHYLSVSDRFGKLKTLKPEFTKLNRLISRDTKLRGLNRDLKTIERYQLPKSDTAMKRAIEALTELAGKTDSAVIADRAKQTATRLQKRLEETQSKKKKETSDSGENG